MINIKHLVFIHLIFSLPIFADEIGVGFLSIVPDNPTGGEQTLTVNNMTGGANCGPGEYTACTNLAFTNWTLTINYTSGYYSPSAGSFVYTDPGSGPFGGFGDIIPSSTNNTFSIDLCGGAGSCANPDSPVTTITSVDFTGQISPSSICIYDATVGGCNMADPTTFFADPNFNLVWDGSSCTGFPSCTGSPYVDEDLNLYAQSPDIVVGDAIATVPEPGSFFLLTALLPLAWLVRRSRSARQSDGTGRMG